MRTLATEFNRRVWVIMLPGKEHYRVTDPNLFFYSEKYLEQLFSS